MEKNKDARQIISQLLENHHTEVSMIAHEIRNPLTLVSSSLQIIEAQHPEVREFSSWNQTMEDVRFMCSLLNDLSTFNNSNSLHHSVFSIERLLKNIAVSFAISLDSDESSEISFLSRIAPGMGEIYRRQGQTGGSSPESAAQCQRSSRTFRQYFSFCGTDRQ